MHNQGPEYVAYYRVSTDKQGRSGLGLEAQRAAVEAFTARTGGKIIAAYQEVESGKRGDRPELLAALELCRKRKAVLLIAKLDRLSRNVAFIANLMESRAKFIACDMPEANETMIQFMAVIAEAERRAISKRTKEALAAAKARGQKLGSPNPGHRQANQAWRKYSAQHRRNVYPLARQLRGEGKTLRQIAQELNERHFKTCNDRVWYPATVNRLLQEAPAS